jgi:hypothetical protein
MREPVLTPTTLQTQSRNQFVSAFGAFPYLTPSPMWCCDLSCDCDCFETAICHIRVGQTELRATCSNQKTVAHRIVFHPLVPREEQQRVFLMANRLRGNVSNAHLQRATIDCDCFAVYGDCAYDCFAVYDDCAYDCFAVYDDCAYD